MKIPLIYLCIHERLKDKFGYFEFPSKELRWMLGKIHHIKKEYHYPIIKELENFKLIAKVNRSHIVLKKINININDTSKIYRSVGLY